MFKRQRIDDTYMVSLCLCFLDLVVKQGQLLLVLSFQGLKFLLTRLQFIYELFFN